MVTKERVERVLELLRGVGVDVSSDTSREELNKFAVQLAQHDNLMTGLSRLKNAVVDDRARRSGQTDSAAHPIHQFAPASQKARG